jgi:SAM-dependent methyltransferase
MIESQIINLSVQIYTPQDRPMATLAENKFVWDGDYDWPQQGDEWSGPWGGPTMQWHAEILPRIHSLIKGKRILEIACGYGRWTQFLIEAAAELTVVDLSQECIEACRARFDGANINFHLNDGTSLKIIETNSIDFIFSYDSLVHAELDVIKKYLIESCQLKEQHLSTIPIWRNTLASV